MISGFDKGPFLVTGASGVIGGALIDPSEVAEAVLFILSRPRNVTIHDIVVLPTNIDA